MIVTWFFFKNLILIGSKLKNIIKAYLEKEPEQPKSIYRVTRVPIDKIKYKKMLNKF
jgi:hypothetical protein